MIEGLNGGFFLLTFFLVCAIIWARQDHKERKLIQQSQNEAAWGYSNGVRSWKSIEKTMANIEREGL